MYQDMWIVFRKELNEIFIMGDARGRGRLGQLFFLGVFGIFMPLMFGAELITQPITIISWAWMPWLLVIGVVADSFAGEKERHTLETLLASRLPDHAILFGKLLAAMTYAVGQVWLILILIVITTNIVHFDQFPLLFSVEVTVGMIVFPVLVALVAASAGVLVSLSSNTVRQAQQILSMSLMVIFIPLVIVVWLLTTFADSEWLLGVITWFSRLNIEQIAIGLAIIMLIAAIVLIRIAMLRFRRGRLILDN